MIIFRSIHIAANGIISFGFCDRVMFHCIYICHIFIRSSVYGHLGCFHVLTVVNDAAVNTGVDESFRMRVLLGYMPSSGVIRSYGSSSSSFLRNLHTAFHSGCTDSDSHKQCHFLVF